MNDICEMLNGYVTPIVIKWLITMGFDINYIEESSGNNSLGIILSWDLKNNEHMEEEQARIVKILIAKEHLDLTANNHFALRESAKKNNKIAFDLIKKGYLRRNITLPEDIDRSIIHSYALSPAKGTKVGYSTELHSSNITVSIIAQAIGRSLGDPIAAWKLIKKCLSLGQAVNFIVYCHEESPFEVILDNELKLLPTKEKKLLSCIVINHLPRTGDVLKLSNPRITKLLQTSNIILPFPRPIKLCTTEENFLQTYNVNMYFLGEYDCQEHLTDMETQVSTGLSPDCKGIFVDDPIDVKNIVTPDFITKFSHKLTKDSNSNKFRNLFFAYFHSTDEPPIAPIQPIHDEDLYDLEYTLDQVNIADFIDYAIKQTKVNTDSEAFIFAPCKNFHRGLLLKHVKIMCGKFPPLIENFDVPYLLINNYDIFCYGKHLNGKTQLTQILNQEFINYILTLVENLTPFEQEMIMFGHEVSYYPTDDYISNFLESSSHHFEKRNLTCVQEYITRKNLDYQLVPYDGPDPHIQYTVSHNGITAYLVDPFPISNQDFTAALILTANPVLVTGDQSFSEAISQDVLFLYQIMEWKIKFFDALIRFMENKGLYELTKFMLSQQFHKDSPAPWKDILLTPGNKDILRGQLTTLREYIYNEKNAYVELPLWLKEISTFQPLPCEKYKHGL